MMMASASPVPFFAREAIITRTRARGKNDSSIRSTTPQHHDHVRSIQASSWSESIGNSCLRYQILPPTGIASALAPPHAFELRQQMRIRSGTAVRDIADSATLRPFCGLCAVES
jgi:hypothetical protein